MRYQSFGAALLFSIVFTASLLAQPIITLSVNELEFDNEPEEPFEYPITIANEGNADLSWRIVLEAISAPDQFPVDEELIGEFNGINAANEYCSPVGWDQDNEWMWVTNYNRNLVVAYRHNNSYTDFEETRRIEIDHPMDGCWIDGMLWLPSMGDSLIHRFDSQGNEVGSVNFPFGVFGLAADDETNQLFILSAGDWFIRIFQLNRDGNIQGEQIGQIENHRQFHGNMNTFGLEWVPEHTDGKLWMTNTNNGSVYQIAVDTENWTCTGEIQHFNVFPDADQPYSSVAHDGNHLWVGGWATSTIKVLNDGIDELMPDDWCSPDLTEGFIEAGADQNVHFTFDLTSLVEGDYVASIHFLSNDPNNPDVQVQLTIHVQGEQEFLMKWPLDEDLPGIIDFNTQFQDVFVRFDYVIPVTLANEGTSDLTINDISVDDEAFRIEPTQFVVPPHGRRVLPLIFLTQVAGVYECVMTVETDDAVNEEVSVNLRADALLPPAISISPIDIDVDYGSMEPLPSIRLQNQGEGTLRWYTFAEVLANDEWTSPFHVSPGVGQMDGEMEDTLTLTVDWDSVRVDPDASVNRLHFVSNDPTAPDVYIQITIHGLGVEPSHLTPYTLKLETFPNPFNSSATISYTLPKSGWTIMDVMDLNGRLVARLSDGWKEAGSYREILSARQIGAGSYFVQLSDRAGSAQTKPLILLK